MSSARAPQISPALSVRGALIWFNEEKDHGYITTDEGERLFVAGQGFEGGRRPQGRCGGLVVEFEVQERNGSREAVGCVLVDEIMAPRARLRRGGRARS
jgi:cold shock CspA family protein